MARSRAQRRRRTVYLILALVVTLLVVVFAQDVTRAAHAAKGPRRSENLSFGQLTNALIARENALDAHLSYLLTHGATLNRPVFASHLDQIDQQLPALLTNAELLHRPVLAHHVQRSALDLLKTWVASEQTIIGATRSSLTLPGSSASPSDLTGAQSSLTSAVANWNFARFSLVKEPGQVHLGAATSGLAHLDLSSVLAKLAGSPHLTLRRGIGVSAVSVSPSPLPAPSGEILLPPVTSVHIGVSVTNHAYCDQPVSLSVTFTPSRGSVQHQVQRVTLGPDGSYAFTLNPLSTAADEHARLVVALRGAPAAATASVTKTYQVVLAPSGT